jgi:hypothetical protein
MIDRAHAVERAARVLERRNRVLEIGRIGAGDDGSDFSPMAFNAR